MTTRNKYSSRNKFEKPFIRKACLLCKIDFLDYKNIGLLKKYISDRGKIESAGRTGTCAKCQRNLTVAIKRARHMAFLPLSADHTLNTKVVIYKQEKIQEKTQEKTVKIDQKQIKETSKTDKKIDASIENKNNDKDVESDNVDLEEKDQKVKNEKKNETSDSESEK